MTLETMMLLDGQCSSRDCSLRYHPHRSIWDEINKVQNARQPVVELTVARGSGNTVEQDTDLMRTRYRWD